MGRRRLKVFLDANILFSAALGGPAFDLLWRIRRQHGVVFVTSPTCIIEARHNLVRKKPERIDTFETRMRDVAQVPEGTRTHVADATLPEKDQPVFDAAVAAQCDVLLTGDRRHFGHLMGRADLPLQVMTVRTFLAKPFRLQG